MYTITYRSAYTGKIVTTPPVASLPYWLAALAVQGHTIISYTR
jgi:hypothetical protein